jgi:hypothetical protein
VSNASATSSVTVNNLPIISVASGSICASKSFTMNPSGANSYTYSSGSSIVSPTTNTTYTVTGASALGCVSQATVAVSVVALPTLTLSSTSTVICSGETATLSVSGAVSYTWNTSSTTVAIIISPTVTTNYTVTGTSAQGCSNTSVISQSVSSCVGIKEVEQIGTTYFTVYPNPTTSVLNIEFDVQHHNTQLLLTDVLGQVMHSEVIESFKTTINTGSLSDGVYFVTVIDGNNKLTKKIIIQ